MTIFDEYCSYSADSSNGDTKYIIVIVVAALMTLSILMTIIVIYSRAQNGETCIPISGV